jgi:thiol:disulfide interchange protein
MSGLSRIFSIFSFVLLAFATPATAQLSLGPVSAKVEVQLIAEEETVHPGNTFWVALKMNIIPDWHVYWRNPGDSGMVTTIDWELPPGVTAGAITWPTPKRMPIPPLLNYGYEQQVLLLVPITTPADLDLPVLPLKAKADWLVCHEVCIPETAIVELNLPVSAETPMTSAWSSAFTATRKQLPQKFDGQVTVRAKDTNDFTITLRDLPIPASETPIEGYFYSGNADLVTHATTHNFSQQGRDIILTVPYNKTVREHPARAEGDVWIRTTQNDYSFAINHAFTAPPVSSEQLDTASSAAQATHTTEPQPTTGLGLANALLLALLGGLVLNLMPCVFPVLSIKALGLVQKSQEGNRREIIMGGLIYTAGVLVSFALLGVVLLLIKMGGHTIDWGMQLQSPLFVTLMIIVLFLIGYTLIGAVTFGSTLMGVGQSLTHKSGHVGTFFTGALAVIVATPCTAPFMGGALFYGFTQQWYIAISILLALGLGLALPYLLICIFPQLLRFLPKPGIWMEHFKQFLSFPMFAAAIWLVWVLGQQAGADGVLRALLAVLMLAFALWVWRSIQRDTHQNIWHYCKAVLVALSFLYVASLLFDQSQAQPVTQSTATEATQNNFEPYSVERLASLRQSGTPVFVNMTAAWCITCLVNEKTALSTDDVKAFFKDNKIAYLKGDWTNRDPKISKFLQEHGRNGVPLYVFYAPGQEPLVLPQILSPKQVITDLKQALSTPTTP